jgi:hexosaminidase
LSVEEDIRITAISQIGLYNALMTLLQLMSFNDASVSIPKVHIEDFPRFKWRGTLIDPARNFLPASIVKQYIDAISELKMNVLHWHLVDDQGWRIESDIFPNLQRTGGRNGYYTKQQIREIVAYADRRNVMVLPEIDMPGHTSALLASYPELSCTGNPVKIRRGPGIFSTALCVSKESVYDFLDRLFGEISELFPCPYIHIGSDEVVANDWKLHESCTSLMSEHNISGKSGLHEYFIHRLDNILKKHGKKMIAWDEITRFLPEGAVVQAWRNHKFSIIAAERGNSSIVSPTSHCYYDYPHAVTSMEKVYSFEPVPEEMPKSLASFIIGAEANLWGEWIKPSRLMKRAFPRMLAHAEVCWSPGEKKDFKDFKKRAQAVSENMRKRGIDSGGNFEPLLILWFGIMKLFDILFIRDKEKG